MFSGLGISVVLLIALTGVQVTLCMNVRLFNKEWYELPVEGIEAESASVAQLEIIAAKLTETPIEDVRLITQDMRYLSEKERMVAEYSSDGDDEDEDLIIKMQDDLKETGRVYVELSSGLLVVEVTREASLAWLKEEVERLSETKQGRVFFDGRELSDLGKTLREYKLYKGAYVIMMEPEEKLMVYLRGLSGHLSQLNMSIDTTVEDLKRLLEPNDEAKKLHLLVGDKLLENSSKLTSYSRNYHQAVLVEAARPIEGDSLVNILYELPSGFKRSFPVNVTSSTTVGDLKRMISAGRRSHSTQPMELKFQAKILGDDSCKLTELNLYQGAWVKVVVRR